MLYDHEAETEREVDILIEANVLGCNIMIGVECTTNRRALDIQKLESFVEKHRKLGINQTIIVSKSGYTSSARAYSKKCHLKLLTFDTAKTENWQVSFERFKNLSMYGRNYAIRSIKLLFQKDCATSDFAFSATNLVKVGDKWTPLHEFATTSFTNSKASSIFHKELRENELAVDDPVLEVGFKLDHLYEFKDANGRSAWPDEIILYMGYRSNYRDLASQQVNYDGTPMVVGGFFDDKSKQFASLAISESSGMIQGTLEVSANFLPPLIGSVSKD